MDVLGQETTHSFSVVWLVLGQALSNGANFSCVDGPDSHNTRDLNR
jgi:hypothetical protein